MRQQKIGRDFFFDQKGRMRSGLNWLRSYSVLGLSDRRGQDIFQGDTSQNMSASLPTHSNFSSCQRPHVRI